MLDGLETISDELASLRQEACKTTIEAYNLKKEKDGTYRNFDKDDKLEIIFDPEADWNKTHRQRFATYYKKLGNDFFLSCPGLVGDIVREAHAFNPQTPASFIFASAASTVGALKGAYARGKFVREIGTNLFFFCFAGPGRGKELPRNLMADAITRSKLFGLKTDEFRSKQGFYLAVEMAYGVQVVLHDEAHHFFGDIRNESAANYLQLKPLLLKLFSAWQRSSLDEGRTVAEQSRPLYYPSVSYCGFGTPSGTEKMFSKEDFGAGWLSRFIIFFEDPELVPESQCFDNKKFEFQKSAPWLQLVEKVKHGQEQRRLYSSQPELIPFQIIQATKKAKKAFLDFTECVRLTRIGLGELDTDIYVRASELVARIATVISADSVELEAVEWAISLVKNTLANTQAILDDHKPADWFEKSEKVLKSLRANRAYSLREIMQRNRFLKDTREAAEILNNLVAENKLREQLDKPSRGRAVKRFLLT